MLFKLLLYAVVVAGSAALLYLPVRRLVRRLLRAARDEETAARIEAELQHASADQLAAEARAARAEFGLSGQAGGHTEREGGR